MELRGKRAKAGDSTEYGPTHNTVLQGVLKERGGNSLRR